MQKISLMVLAVTVMPAVAYAAPFEGVVEMKMTTKGGAGTMTMSIGKKAMRNEMNIQTPQFPVKMTMLFKKDTPDVAYTINDQDKSYGEIDLKKTRDKASEMRKFTAKKLGTEKINGWDTVHAMVTDDQGNETEVWTNKDIVDWKTFLSTMGQNSPANEGLMKALADVGAEGFFVKMIAGRKGRDEKMTMELVKAEKKSLPASLFEIPKDYKKGEGMMGGAQLPPEVQKQLMEKMKNLTPEQQEQIKRAMQQQQQQGQPPQSH